MKSNWNATLERWTRCIPRKSKIMTQAAVVENSAVVSTKDGWADADSLTGLDNQEDGSLVIEYAVTDKITHETQDGYLTDLNRASPLSVAQIEWRGSDEQDFPITKVQAWLHPDRVGGNPQTVTQWGCQIHALYKVEEVGKGDDLLTILPIGNTVFVDEGGTIEHEVTFNFSGPVFLPRPKRYRVDDPSETFLAPTTFIQIIALKVDGSPADNVGWGKDSATASVTDSSNILTGATLTESVDPEKKGLYTIADTGETPYVTISEGTVAQQTVEYTTNDLDLGAVPSSADDVVFVVQGSELAGTTLTASARVPAGSYLPVTDGQTATDAGIAASQTYEMKCVLDPDTGGITSPILRRLGVEDVAITDITSVADVKEIHRQVDPVTLKSYVTTAKMVVLQDGVRDYNDAITTLLSTKYIGQIQFRVYLGHEDLDREFWMSLGVFLEPTYNAIDGGLAISAISPLALVRKTLPAYNTGTNTRDPLIYAGTTLKATYDDLLDGQIELAGRFRGPGIEDDVTTVDRFINEELQAKDMLGAIAFLGDSTVGESQGLVQAFDIYGDKAVEATFASESINPVYVTPGYEERMPEWLVQYDWSEDERRYLEIQRYEHASSLVNLGTAALNDREELEDDVAKWITATALANKVGQQAVDFFGPGLIRLGFNSTYAYPELEVGDMVAVETDRFTAVDPNTANAVKGRLWVLAVVVDHDTLGENFVVWVRGYEDIFSSASAGTVTVGLRRFFCGIFNDSDTTLDNSGSEFQWGCDNEFEDNADMHDTVTNNSRIYCPTGGKGRYSVKAIVHIGNDSFAPPRDVTFAFKFTNSVSSYYSGHVHFESQETGVHLMAADLDMEDGDYVELIYGAPSGGTGSVDVLSDSTAQETRFWISRRGVS